MKKLVYSVIALILIGIAVAAYMWNKPHEKVEDAKGIAITAVDLFKEYSADESKANEKYLSKDKGERKALEVNGSVSEVKKNDDGTWMVLLATEDMIGGVKCTMREKDVSITKDSKVAVKGYCSGFITDVVLTDCVLMK